MQIKYNNGEPRLGYFNEEGRTYVWRRRLARIGREGSSHVHRGFINIENYFNNRMCQNPGSGERSVLRLQSNIETINENVFRFPNGKRGLFVDVINFNILHSSSDSGREIATIMEVITGLSLHDTEWLQENHPGLHVFGNYAVQQIKSQE